MNFLFKLFGKKQPKKNIDDSTLIEVGACPNCWGIMEYDNQYVAYVKDQTKSNINKEKLNQKAFVQQFVETHVTGIHLKKDGDKSYCPKCNSRYKYTSTKAN